MIIKRTVDNPSKISFKLNSSKLKEFQQNFNWDEENLPFDKAKKKLDEYLGFNVLLNWSYRKTVTYFLRSQQDYQDVFKLNKFKGKDKDWKPMVFDLLGFDGNIIKEKAELEEKQEELLKKIDILKKEAKIDTSEKDKIQGLLEIKKDEKEHTEMKIDKFNFFEKDKAINQQLVDEIDTKIQILNTQRYNISFEIEKIESSLSLSINEIDVNEVKQIYDEVKVYFPLELLKSYEQLIEFNKSITQERRKYLKENLNELKRNLKEIDIELEKIEAKKEDLLNYLTDRDSYAKFKESQKLLSKLEAAIINLEDKLKLVDQVSEIENEIQKIQHSLEAKTKEIKEQIDLRKHAEIRKTFNGIISSVLNVPAIISISQNKYGNVEFNANIQNPQSLEITAEDFGTSYRKLLSMAFDLSVLIHYSSNSFFRFVYHDGALEGLDDRKKNKFLGYVKNICKDYNLQYIFTLIDSDLPKNMNNEIIAFPKEEICLELHDKDDSGKLFGICF
ncbi:DUF2326 domain-containing protein [candidate division KSB1 bacterium]|nr:DUF2326 domain-containing protein [candidate division KSB1 bacterium]